MKKGNNSSKIFVSIASFCDPLLWYTVESAVRKASDPSQIHFSIIEQSHHASDEHIKVSALSKINYRHVEPAESAGVCWARNLAMQQYSGENYFLQIDSHTVFDDFWDKKLIKTHQNIKMKTGGHRTVLSTRPMPFKITDGRISREGTDANTLILEPSTRTINRKSSIIHFDGRFAADKKAYRGIQIAAAFVFSEGHIVEEVPYDPLMYFHGEEQNFSLRLFCAGWDIWHVPNVPLYHLYKNREIGEPLLHWDLQFEEKRAIKWHQLQKKSNDRLYSFYKNTISDRYKLSKQRSVEDFARFCKFDIV